MHERAHHDDLVLRAALLIHQLPTPTGNITPIFYSILMSADAMLVSRFTLRAARGRRRTMPRDICRRYIILQRLSRHFAIFF